MSDPVNHPAHYTDGGIETIDFIRAKLGPDGFRSFCIGNAMKYVSRAGKKDDFEQDVRKAIWYLNAAVEARPVAVRANIRKPDADGWIPHDGGPCPVGGEERVEVRFRSLSTADYAPAKAWSWGHQDRLDDIIAWRRA